MGGIKNVAYFIVLIDDITFAPRSLSTARCVCGASHLFPASTLTTSGAAF